MSLYLPEDRDLAPLAGSLESLRQSKMSHRVMSNETNQDSDYEYANAYFYFLKALKTVSEDAERQCEVMDYFNVAWELRDEAVGWANAILTLRGGGLSTEQRDAIVRFAAGLRALPSDVINVDNAREEHLRAMNSSSWTSIRLEARNLKKMLEAETQRVNSILWPDGKAR